MCNDSTKKKRLLLVEDHPDNLTVLTVMLSEKYEVSGYGSAVDALSGLDAFKPHLVSLDVGMTPVNGMQCLEAIRAKPEYRSIPAIALTAFAHDSEKEAILAAGFQAVVTKPILDPRELEAVIDRLLTPHADLQDPPRIEKTEMDKILGLLRYLRAS